MTSVSGVRGIGKTAYLADVLQEHYKKGFLCISNFHHVYSHIDCSERQDMIIDVIREIGEFKKQGYELCDLLPSFKHTGVFIAIDEAHLIFGSDQVRRYQSDENFQFIIQFLAQARKQDVNIFYSSQNPSKIDVNWRRYTEDWIQLRPVLSWTRRKWTQHPSRPILRRELRYIFPLIWEEYHDLDHNQPKFNYGKTTVEDEGGRTTWSKHSTVIRRRLRRTGWMKPETYKMYDSHQMIGLEPDEGAKNFEIILKNISYIPPAYVQKELFPTFKKILGIPTIPTQFPTRYKFSEILLPVIDPPSTAKYFNQPEKKVADLRSVSWGGVAPKIAAKIAKSRYKSIENNDLKKEKKPLLLVAEVLPNPPYDGKQPIPEEYSKEAHRQGSVKNAETVGYD